MSGQTSACSAANHEPRRPKPVTISSKISRTPVSSQRARRPRRYSGERACTPAVSRTGSTMIAETVPAPSCWIERAGAGAGAARGGNRWVRVETAGEERLVRRAQLRPPGRSQGTHGRPVVGAVEGDRLVAPRAAALVVVLARHLQRRLRCLRAAVELLDDVIAATGEAHQLAPELERPIGGGHDRRRERELPVLRHDRVDDGVVAVPQADGEDAREAVDVPASLVVCEREPVSLDHDQRIGGKGLHLVEIDHHMARRLTEVKSCGGGARRFGHGGSLSLSDQRVKS
jgi:hypothetical protein